MAGEIKFVRDNTYNYFVVIRRYSDGKMWYPGGESWQNWGVAQVTAFAIEADKREDNSDEFYYEADFPAGQLAGKYLVDVYIQAGASPASDDEWDGTFEFLWDGEKEVDPIVQDRSLKLWGSDKVVFTYNEDNTQTMAVRNDADTDNLFVVTITPSGDSEVLTIS